MRVLIYPAVNIFGIMQIELFIYFLGVAFWIKCDVFVTQNDRSRVHKMAACDCFDVFHDFFAYSDYFLCYFSALEFV